MLRNIAGIMADEEPKTPISVSGLYNSSSLTGSSGNDFVLDSTTIGGLSEFTFMAWFYLSPSNTSNFALYPYQENHSGFNSLPIYFFEDEIKTSIWNSNGGQSTTAYSTTTPINQWVYVAVTGSVTNGRIRLYLNGVLVSSSTMTYSNDVTTGAFFENYNFSTDDVDVAQVNTYNRELSETEVAEHYVYDDDTMTSGVLGWDAMTPAQRSGLIYSSSYTDDISISGNEFNDKSGNGITISPQPSLTGQQIYFYTNASDLPSDIYNVNSATLDGSSQFYNIAGTTSQLETTVMTITGRVLLNTGAGRGCLYTWEGGSNGGFSIYSDTDGTLAVQIYDSGGGITKLNSPSALTNDIWHSWGATYDNAVLRLYIDGSEVSNVSIANGLGSGAGNTAKIGAYWNNGLVVDGGVSFVSMLDRVATASELSTLLSTIPKCSADILTETPSLADWIFNFNLADWDGNTADRLTNNGVGAITLVPINSPTYTDQGLTVECTS